MGKTNKKKNIGKKSKTDKLHEQLQKAQNQARVKGEEALKFLNEKKKANFTLGNICVSIIDIRKQLNDLLNANDIDYIHKEIEKIVKIIDVKFQIKVTGSTTKAIKEGDSNKS